MAKRSPQSRLTFTPLPSSSPAAKGYHKQIQDRAAAVGLDSSPGPSKRRKIDRNDIPQLDGGDDSIPTPAASAMQPRNASDQVEIVDSSENDSDSEPVRSTQQKRRPKQQRIDFSNARQADSFSSPVRLSSPSRPQSSRAGIFGTQRQRPVIDVSSDESSDDDLPSPGKFLTRSKARRADEVSARSAQPEESEGENIVVSSEPANRIEAQSEDESDDMPTTIGRQKRKRAKRESSFISSSPPRASDSDDDLQIIEKPRKRSRRDKSITADDESEIETPKRKNLKRSRKSQREKDDLADDLHFLGPSSDVETSRKPRSTQSAKKDAKAQALEKLKRQRLGLPAVSDEDEDDDEAPNYENYDTTPDYEVQPRRGTMTSAQMFNEDENDQDFVEEDNEDTLGVPDDLPLEFTRYASMKPKELFKYAVEWMIQKKINPAFEMKDGLYDLTFRKLDDEVKGLAGSKFTSAAWTPDFTMSLNARPDIAYDTIDRSSDAHWLRDHCDACNRSKHPATYQIQFQGKPYNRQSLEELGANDDDDDDSSEDDNDDENDKDDEPDYDANGQQIPAASTIYYVGKFCHSNALTAHALQHWRYHLNEWVVNWLSKEGYCTDELVVKRDKMSTKKRRKEANKITDRMEQEGVIKTLWKDFYQNINEARNSKQGRYRIDSP